MKQSKRLCTICLTVGKGFSWSCGVQGHPIMSVSDKIRFPKKDESKSKWIKVLDIAPFNNEYHRSQPEFQQLLKTLNTKTIK